MLRVFGQLARRRAVARSREWHSWRRGRFCEVVRGATRACMHAHGTARRGVFRRAGLAPLGKLVCPLFLPWLPPSPTVASIRLKRHDAAYCAAYLCYSESPITTCKGTYPYCTGEAPLRCVPSTPRSFPSMWFLFIYFLFSHHFWAPSHTPISTSPFLLRGRLNRVHFLRKLTPGSNISLRAAAFHVVLVFAKL